MNRGGELQLTSRSVHLCVDMQRLFSSDGPWCTPWMDKVLPIVTAIARRHVTQTIFTRFIPPHHPSDMPGAWRIYYERWRNVTRDRLDPQMIELMPPLAALTPPAAIVDKHVFSAFTEGVLARALEERQADALVVTGLETDSCVAATVLGAIDFGYRVVVVRDAVCSSSNDGHDALLTMFEQRFSEQLKVVDSETLMRWW
jgi:nicotinamidase-related amidase